MRRRTLLTAAGAASVAGTSLAAAAIGKAADPPIVVGQSAILSGPVSAYMRMINAGTQLYFDQVNSSGGIHGRPVQFTAVDDGLDPARAAENYRKLADEDGVIAMLTCIGSQTTLAAEPVLRKTGVPLVGGYAVSDSAREATAGVAYYVRAGYAREMEALVRHLSTIGVRRVFLVHLANAGGAEVLRQFEDAARRYNSVVAGSSAVKVDGSDAEQAAAAVVKADPQAVILFCSGLGPGAVMKQVLDGGSRPTFYGMSIVSGELVAKQLGERMKGLTISQAIPYPWSRTDSFTRRYQEVCMAAKVEPTYYSLEGYINAAVLTQALRTAGPKADRRRLHSALQGLKATFGAMSVDFRREATVGSRFVELVQVTQNGRFVR